jgi:hypothetical protein
MNMSVQALQVQSVAGLRKFGVLIMLVGWGTLVAISVATGGFGNLLTALWAFLSGDLSYLRSVAGMPVGFLTAATAVLLPLIMLTGMVVALVGGPVESHALLDQEASSDGTLKAVLMLVGEEVLARWLFLGLFTIWFTGSTAFYILFFVGNGLWAALHLINFTDADERKLIMVLPQFVLGVVLVVVYVTCGLLAVVLVHLIHNALMLSGLRGMMALQPRPVTVEST